MLLLEVTETLGKFKVPYAIVGGYAVSLHGATRGTFDIDLIIPFEEKYFVAAEKAFQSIKLTSRLPVSAKEVFAFRDEYIKNRKLISWSFHDINDPLRLVDVILTENLNDVQTISLNIKKKEVKIISKEDLIRIKSKANRPQDIEDIKALRRIK